MFNVIEGSLVFICAEDDPSTHLPTGREERSVAGVPRHSEMPEKFARWLEIFHVMDTKADVFGRWVGRLTMRRA